MALRPEIRTPQSGQKRLGRGFTNQELKDAGISISDARWMAIPVDHRRRTHHPENVAILKDYIKRLKKLEKKTKAPKTKKPPAKPKPSKPAPIAIETDLTDLKGVGKKLADTLVASGITSIRALSTTAPRRLARITELKRDRATNLVDIAKRHTREKTRVTRAERTKKPEFTELKHLPGITRNDVRTLRDLGVSSLEELKVENPRDLSLLTGIPESRIKEWKKLIRSLPTD